MSARTSKVTGIRSELDRLLSTTRANWARFSGLLTLRPGKRSFPDASHPAATRPDPPAPLRRGEGMRTLSLAGQG
jgi:hypothetical protein